ncbi:hypothetical protein ABTX15_32625 [Micromonospora sp. NPDC094482]|uniref:hypothetical protein n=1 Tax=unclassified Micromonospora TaxID=2617518 RepID=UPI0033343226
MTTGRSPIDNEGSRLADEVLAAYLRYLDAFITNDIQGLDAVVAYPLAHIAESDVQMHDVFPINPAELKRSKDWYTTRNSRFQVLAVSPSKAHVVLYSADRVREDGSLIETVSAFYAFKLTDDGWKIYAFSDVVNSAPH